MLIQALCSYYDVLASQQKILPEGYSNVRIHYLVSLTPDGQIDGVIDWQQKKTTEGKNGKVKEVTEPRTVLMPRRTEKPGIDANFIEHRPLYIFGLNRVDDTLTPTDKTQKAKKSHDAFVTKNRELLQDIDSPVVKAFLAFLDAWQPENETENPYLLSLGKAYATAGFAFCLSGRPDLLLHEDEQVNAVWKEAFRRETENSDAVTAQCGITGQTAPIARIHDKIKGVPGGLATGNTLISFKNAAESSYGHEQSYNSNVSEAAMRKYTEALNYLLAGREHKTVLDDMTVLHWAASDNENCDRMFDSFLNFGDKMDTEQTDNFLKKLMEDAREGNFKADRLQTLDDIDPNVDFYIVGLKPNSARLSVKFIYRKKFGDILYHIAEHQNDMQARPDAKPVPLWRIKNELNIPNSKNAAVDPSLMTKIIEAAVYGHDYPYALLAGVIRRVKADSDSENNSYIKMNDVRIGIIKACLNRKARRAGKKEEIKLALDKTNTDAAYLCGRLFAVLESIQLRSANYSLNRTIKDAYFSSACAKPATVFPKLMRLTQYHLAKLGNPRYLNDEIAAIVDLLGSEFPSTLSLEAQGKFIIGYYHQKSDTDTKIKEAQEAKKNDNF